MSLRVMVTGASGFVGREFCAECAKFGNEVIAAVRRPQTFDGKVRPVVVGDLGDKGDWHEALQGVNVVVHLAARVHMMSDRADDPLAEFRRVNVDGTLNLARQAASAGVRRFIFLSSVKVNGEATASGQSFSADDIPAPQDAYAASKLEAELGLRQICSDTGMEFVVVRPPLVYGPGVKGNFRTLLHCVQRGMPLPLGALDNRRSLLALGNLLDLITICLTHPAASNQVFLAADGECVSTTDMLLKIARAYKRPSRLIPVPAGWLRSAASILGKQAAADRLLGSLVVDISKTRDLLGWTPAISMDEQLRKMASDDSRT